jgi:hypothetical protein
MGNVQKHNNYIYDRHKLSDLIHARAFKRADCESGLFRREPVSVHSM